MILTKTPTGTYDKRDYWTISYIGISSDNPDDKKEAIREYADSDSAYEDYCYYRKKWWVKDCIYKHHKR